MGWRETAKPVVRLARAVPVWPRAVAVSSRSAGPLVVFLPAYGGVGAALLRIYRVAEGLRSVGWRSLVLPSTLTLAQRRRFLAFLAPDLVVMQGARHALNRPELYPDQPVVYDLDDADFHLPHLVKPVEDAMGRVVGVIAGSRYIADWCRGRGARADVVWTATDVSSRPAPPHQQRPPVVAWAQTAPETYSKEADWVLAVMQRVSARMPQVRLRLYDRRGGEGADFLRRFRAAGITTEWRQSMRYGDYLASFDDVAVGLAPLSLETPFSCGKSFGKVLAYLDRRVPVVASDACEHGRFFDAHSALVSNDMDMWVEGLQDMLGAPALRQSRAEHAHRLFRQRLSLGRAVARTDGVLRSHLRTTAC